MAENRNKNQGTMSRSEAGRMGGEAPHTCRGRECSEGQGSRSHSASSRGESSSSHGRSSSSHGSQGRGGQERDSQGRFTSENE